MIDGALATTMLIGSTLGTTGVDTAAPAVRTAVVVQLDEPDVGAEDELMPVYQPRPAGDAVQVGYQPTPAGDPAPRPPSAATPDDSMPTTRPERPTDDPSSIPSPATYTVRPGDNLWTIAEQHLLQSAVRPGRELHIDDIRAYWLQIVEANGDRVRSGDPNRIVPDEHIELP
jgi:nucleoid-associated protein YgaU